MAPSKFTGMYRGIVLNNSDPMQAGRLLVMVPSVIANRQPVWALPYSPLTTGEAGGSQAPAVNSTVQIEYEEGNPHYPIWLNSGPLAELGGFQNGKPIRWFHAGDKFSRLRRMTLSPAHLLIRR
jgi:hypothetical protein